MCPVLILWSLWNLVTRSDFYFWNPKIGWNNMSTAPKREEPCDNKLSICDILGSSGNDKKSLELSVQGALWAGEQDQLVGERHGSPAERLPDLLSEQSEWCQSQKVSISCNQILAIWVNIWMMLQIFWSPWAGDLQTSLAASPSKSC